MSKKQNKKSIENSAYELLLAEEELILHAQMLIQGVLNASGISQKKLAEKLGVGESYVSQMLGTSARNLTLRTIARVMKALDVKATLVLDDYVEPAAKIEKIEATSDSEVSERASAIVASSVSGDEEEAKAVASKLATAQLSQVWGQVIELPPRKRARRREQDDAAAFAAFDPQMQAFEPRAQAFEPEVQDMALAA